MKNRNVGFLIIGMSVIIGIIVLIFNLGLKKIVGLSCTHGLSCSMYDTISVQTWLSLAIASLIFFIGLFFVFVKEKEKIIIRKVRERKKKIDFSKLDVDEKRIINLLRDENGALFQRTMMEKLVLDKVKTTRLLDKLEAKQLIERKRRGMNNIVVLRK